MLGHWGISSAWNASVSSFISFPTPPPPSNTYPFSTQNLPACLCGIDLPTTYVYVFTGFRFSLLSQYLNHVRLLKIRRHINFISLNLVAHLFKFSPINFFIWYLYFMTQFSWYYLTQACSNRLDRIRLTLHSAPCSYFLTVVTILPCNYICMFVFSTFPEGFCAVNPKRKRCLCWAKGVSSGSASSGPDPASACTMWPFVGHLLSLTCSYPITKERINDPLYGIGIRWANTCKIVIQSSHSKLLWKTYQNYQLGGFFKPRMCTVFTLVVNSAAMSPISGVNILYLLDTYLI